MISLTQIQKQPNFHPRAIPLTLLDYWRERVTKYLAMTSGNKPSERKAKASKKVEEESATQEVQAKKKRSTTGGKKKSEEKAPSASQNDPKSKDVSSGKCFFQRLLNTLAVEHSETEGNEVQESDLKDDNSGMLMCAL